jgi:acetolactate synthase-1/2/3 large subunit
MGEIYGGHLVAKHLKEIEGVSTIFTLAGGHIDRIYDGCFEHRIKLIDVRHEQAAAMMAHGWSIWGKQPGVCLVTAGPGFANALTGLVNASLDNVPLVLISGVAPIRDIDRGALQGMDQSTMVRSLVKWAGTCHDVKRIPEYIAIAFRHAVAGRPGPVFLEFPPDVLDVKVKEEEIPIPPSGSKIYRSEADPDVVIEAANLINRAERPLIIGGSGIGFSSCDATLSEFVNKTGTPFLFLDNGRGAIPDDHPLSLWDAGNMAMLIGLSMADLIVVLGIRYNWLLLYGQSFPQAKVVRIDIDATEIDRNRQSDVGLVGDMALILKQLNPLIDKGDHSSWLKSLKDLYLPAIDGEVKARTTIS